MAQTINAAKARLRKGELALGCGIRLVRNVDIIKIMKAAGFDWMFIDLEHGSMSIETACELSVAEACANVVEHSASGRLRVVIRRSATRFSVAVCDEGIPFRPPPEPGLPPSESEGGRGVALMATCMDRIRVVRAGAENRLLMARRVELSRLEEETWR